ncbi:MAG: hypothetical protein HND44_15705 [Chloroflexi bacterium]|nr:hypothetical protein [Ardenticatenaceae bacterium]MBL1129907.1 hypothetical protein [Chloroflexota bacterium]NOG35993.1 hypothetical protein [Chloroflexota bacterium]GIK55444.1 MAG: hypothetical protein BroJett015_11070 [Chloroflexota bacterium]
MGAMKEKLPQYAICIVNNDYPASLELHKVYRLVPDEEAALDGDVRVIHESGEDYLYPADYFVLIMVPQEKAQLLRESFVPYST